MKIVVAGASRGIGAAVRRQLESHGHEVWSLARNPAESERSTRCDVSVWNDVATARDLVGASWLHVDAVLCVAAIQGAIGPAMAADPAAWSATVRVNLDGTYFVIRAFWELLRCAPRRGKIICFSGGGATKARPNFSAYAASKTGIVRLVETLAEEWKDLPVDINAIAPGAINTAMTGETVRLGPERAGRVEFEAAQRQLESGGQPIEKALGLVEFLLSEKSDGITGRLLSAQWDDWASLGTHTAALAAGEIFQLRRILPAERGEKF